MMKRTIFMAALAVALPGMVWAQTDKSLEKKVEVTKTYTPKVEHADKLAIVPNMTDTARLHPQIDYTITPLSLQTRFEMTPIRPATVTYWEFNRPQTIYLKAGAGYPLNSVLDFYIASQNPGTGYVVGYMNHEGRYDKIRNDFGVKNNSTEMFNRGGVAAGKYLGRYVLEGDLRYENRMNHRYGAYADGGEMGSEYGRIPGSMADFSAADLVLRFGDDFQDLNRTNFDLTVCGGYFFDHSEWVNYSDKARQMNLNVDLRIARKFNRHTLAFNAGYEMLKGYKSLSDHTEHLVRVGARYAITRAIWQIEAGADVCFSKIVHSGSEWYVLPYVRSSWNFGMQHFVPFVELDAALHNNDYRSLSEENPFLVPGTWEEEKSVVGNLRFGIGGSLWHNKFTYRIYGGLSRLNDHLSWYGVHTGSSVETLSGAMFALMPSRAHDITEWSFNAELKMRPIGALSFNLGFHASHYENDTIFGLGKPDYRGNFSVEYDHEKFKFGASADVESKRWWTVLYNGTMGADGEVHVEESEVSEHFTAPLAVDVRLLFEWKFSAGIRLFAEGFNLADAKLYRLPCYRMSGAGFTMGVKMQF